MTDVCISFCRGGCDSCVSRIQKSVNAEVGAELSISSWDSGWHGPAVWLHGRRGGCAGVEYTAICMVTFLEEGDDIGLLLFVFMKHNDVRLSVRGKDYLACESSAHAREVWAAEWGKVGWEVDVYEEWDGW